MNCRLTSVASLLFAITCATSSCITPQSGPDAEIPRFEANDPRVETAGFVAQTLRLSKEIDERKFTLMAFAVGDELTLGAMVKGEFAGRVQWTLGERELSFDMDTAGSLADIEVLDASSTSSAALLANGASFRGTHWLNIGLPASALESGAALQLAFHSASGASAVILPEDDVSYAARYVEK